MLYVIAKFVVKPEKRDEFIAVSKDLVIGSRNEEGCIQYTFTSSDENPNTFYVLETWQSQEIFDKHAKSEHFNKAVPLLGELCAEPLDISVLSDVHA